MTLVAHKHPPSQRYPPSNSRGCMTRPGRTCRRRAAPTSDCTQLDLLPVIVSRTNTPRPRRAAATRSRRPTRHLFSARQLSHPMRTADPVLHDVQLRLADQELLALSDKSAFPAQVRSVTQAELVPRAHAFRPWPRALAEMRCSRGCFSTARRTASCAIVCAATRPSGCWG
jgi:hypothetical protein